MLISLLKRFGEDKSVNPNHVTSVVTKMVPSRTIGKMVLGAEIRLLGEIATITVPEVTAEDVTLFLNANEGEAECLTS